MLVRACEEADRDGRLLPLDLRERAGRAAPAPPGTAGRDALEAYVAERARALSGPLFARWPGLRRALAVAGVPVPAWIAIVVAGAGGLVLERLGASRRIDLLAFPLLGLILWNLAVYAVMLARPWRWRRNARPDKEPLASAGLLRGLIWLAGPGRWRLRSGAVDTRRRVAETVRRFVRHWLRAAGPLVGARAERLLHLGAASFGAGAVLGMYVRGLAVEYRAGWESTFLTTPAVAALFRIVLGPAAWILHRLAPGTVARPDELFAVEHLDRLRGPAVSGEAAVWIHLWALTAVLVIVAPRLALAWRASHHVRALAADVPLPLDDPYFLRVLAATRGAGVLVEVIPYSFRPSAAVRERASRLLLDLYGSHARLQTIEPPGYGDPPPVTAADPHVPRRVAVLFNLAQSPELEVHGEFLDALRGQLSAWPAGGEVLVLLDDEAYRARLGDSAARVGERRRAWERFGEGCGIPMISLPGAVDGDTPPDQDILVRARDALAGRPREAHG